MFSMWMYCQTSSSVQLDSVKKVPQLGPLVFGIPLPKAVAKRIHALLGPRFFFIPAGSSKRCVVAPFRQGVEQRASLEQPAAFLGTQPKRVGAIVDGLLVDVNDELGADFLRKPVTELYHFTKLIGRVDVQQGKWDFAGIERLLRQPHHHRRVLADGVEHDGPLKLRCNLAHDENTFGFEEAKVG
jgi:hypothetical protein